MIFKHINIVRLFTKISKRKDFRFIEIKKQFQDNKNAFFKLNKYHLLKTKIPCQLFISSADLH